MADQFGKHNASPSAPGSSAPAVAANDAADMAEVAKSVTVTSTSGGDVLQVLPVENADGDWVTYEGVAVGFFTPFRVRRVGTGTTCAFRPVLG